MKPENVKSSKFKVISILFDNDNFSIAYGIWEDDVKTIAMRWNGEDDEVGFPQSFGNPVWFILEKQLQLPLLKSIIGEPNTNKEKLLQTISELT